MQEPNFVKSKWFDSEKWELKPGAPDDLVKEFNKFKEMEEKYSPLDNIDL